MKSIEASLRDRILYVGNEIPTAIAKDHRMKFVILGSPQNVIDETRSEAPAIVIPAGCTVVINRPDFPEADAVKFLMEQNALLQSQLNKILFAKSCEEWRKREEKSA